MNFNLKCDDFRNNLLKLINQSELPVAAIYYIYKDVFNQIQKSYIGAINSIILNKQKDALENPKQTQPIKLKGEPVKNFKNQQINSIDDNDSQDKNK